MIIAELKKKTMTQPVQVVGVMQIYLVCCISCRVIFKYTSKQLFFTKAKKNTENFQSESLLHACTMFRATF